MTCALPAYTVQRRHSGSCEGRSFISGGYSELSGLDKLLNTQPPEQVDINQRNPTTLYKSSL